MRPKQLVISPRSTSRQIKNLATLELNSYKIDTSSLSQKALEIQLLKTELETQISQYKRSQMTHQEQLKQLTDQNKELKAKIRRLQTELNQLKSQPIQNKRNPQTNQLKSLKNKIATFEQEIQKLNKELKKKDLIIEELQEYKKMYNIQVQNKNNIMNFYQNKLALFQKDKTTLISKYQQKISQLGSALQVNATTIQIPPNLSNLPFPNSRSSQQRLSNIDQQIHPNFNEQKPQQKVSAPKIVKIIRMPNKNNITSKDSQSSDSSRSKIETPHKILNIESNRSLQKLRQIPALKRNSKNQDTSISISSNLTNKNDLFFSRNTKDNNSPKKNTKETDRTISKNHGFLKLIREIFNNLRRQNIKSESLKNFGAVRNFLSIANPSSSETIEMLQSFPFVPISMSRFQIEECIQRMKRHLEKKYSLWSANLLVQLLIDKIEDFQIAYEVNSEDEAQIVAGLSSNQEDD